jgi:two-component system sensor histidine kinase RegB
MSTDAGLAVGESISETTVGAVVREAVEGLGPNPRIKTKFVGTSKNARLKVPLHGLAQAIRAILKNAVDAEEGRHPAKCQVSVSGEKCILRVRDQGAGMDTETLRRVGEPFFTTKDPQNGTGLGVFLARNVIEGLAGKLEISSSPGKGTGVQIELPLSPGPELGTSSETK